MKIAINGFGRIGRAIFRIGLEKGVDFVAINDLCGIKKLVYLLKYDSVYGKLNKKIEIIGDFIKIGNKKIKILSEPRPEKLPWKKLGVDVVMECTGRFRKRKDNMLHLKAGAKKVLISAPAMGSDLTVALGINEKQIEKNHKIISMASCTTNCLAPVAKVLDEEFGIVKGFMTTIHAYTNDQGLLDVAHEKLRRGRAAAVNIVPTSSGATSAVTAVLPNLNGKLDGLAMRVPVACGSIVDFVVELNKDVSVEEINNVLKKAATGKLKGILEYSEEELVSSDIIGNKHSAIVDGLLTQANGNMIKVLAWYDNEYGYSTRMIELLKFLK